MNWSKEEREVRSEQGLSDSGVSDLDLTITHQGSAVGEEKITYQVLLRHKQYRERETRLLLKYKSRVIYIVWAI